MTSKTKARLIAQANSIGTNGATSTTTTPSSITIPSASASSSSSSSRRRRRHARDDPSNTSVSTNTTTQSSSRRRGSGSGSSRSSHSRSSQDDGGGDGGGGGAVPPVDVDANGARFDDDEPVFQSQLYALEEFERAFVSERAALGLAPTSATSGGGGDSGSSSRSHRRRHQRLGSSSPPQPRRRRSSPSSVLLTTAGVPLLDALLENIVVMKSGRWDCIELISAPAFGEVVRVEDQGILLIAPTRTHVHIPSRPTDAKLCVLNHLLETLQYPHTAEFDEAKSTIVLINAENGVRADLRTPVIVPTPLYLRSERATRGIITAMPGEIVVSPSGRTSAKSAATASSAATAAAADAEPAASAAAPAAPAVVGDGGGLIQRKNKLSRVQWRLSRNIALEFRSDQEH